MAKLATPHAVRGTQDMYGETQERFAHVIDTFNRVRRLYGFKGVEVPVIEPTAVFARSLGETTDVVSKEMYSFDDRGGDSVTLRPEFTAGIARAYLTNGWQQHAPMKIATSGPLFRYERPQKGRYRQFHQLDAEVIGAAEPLADVELLCFADQLLKELGIDSGVVLTLNTLGDAGSRDAWRAALVDHFAAHRGSLSEDSVDRLERNPLRILDSKDARDARVVETAPGIDDYLTSEASDFFAAVTSGLDAAGVAWTRNSRLVRGLDYYRHTAFEFVTNRLGAQGTVIGGGRYDGLIEALGGPATPAVGWAAGIERLEMLLKLPANHSEVFGIIPERPEAAILAQKIAGIMRRQGLFVDQIYSGRSSKQLDKLKRRGITTALFVDVPDQRSKVIGIVNFKRFRGFRHPVEKIVATRLAQVFSIENDFAVVSEMDFRGSRADMILVESPIK